MAARSNRHFVICSNITCSHHFTPFICRNKTKYDSHLLLTKYDRYAHLFIEIVILELSVVAL